MFCRSAAAQLSLPAIAAFRDDERGLEPPPLGGNLLFDRLEPRCEDFVRPERCGDRDTLRGDRVVGGLYP